VGKPKYARSKERVPTKSNGVKKGEDVKKSKVPVRTDPYSERGRGRKEDGSASAPRKKTEKGNKTGE